MIDPSGNMSMLSLTATIAMDTALIGLRAYGIYDTASTLYNGSLDDLSVQSMIFSVMSNKLGGKIFNRLMQSKMMLSLGKKYQNIIDRYKNKNLDCPVKNSFDGTTLVATENGLVPIEEIKIGDKVWAYNEANQTKSLQEVTHLIRGENYKELIDIELTSGEVITATDNHPFWELNTKEWITADELTNSSILLNINDKNTTIKSLKHYAKNKKVYNLTVNNFHTYYVGVSGVLSHNCKFDIEVTFDPTEIKRGNGIDKINQIIERFGGNANDWRKVKAFDQEGNDWHWYENKNDDLVYGKKIKIGDVTLDPDWDNWVDGTKRLSTDVWSKKKKK